MKIKSFNAYLEKRLNKAVIAEIEATAKREHIEAAEKKNRITKLTEGD